MFHLNTISIFCLKDFVGTYYFLHRRMTEKYVKIQGEKKYNCSSGTLRFFLVF